MPTLTIDEVQSRLSEIIDGLHPGEELDITRNHQIVARLLPPRPTTGVPEIGRGKDRLVSYVNDDEHRHLPARRDL
jgi:antitoxin (DNA-binding transcriptional repressor) of toxin-antitoxin stability system